jgi:hypothetical protein
MPIISSVSWTIPNDSVQFHYNSELPYATQTRELDSAFTAAGNANIFVAMSDSNLTMTITSTFSDLNSLNTRNAAGASSGNVNLDSEFMNFVANTGQKLISRSVTGIDVPFTVTTTYSFATGANTDSLVTALNSTAPLLTNLTVGTSSIVATHQYANTTQYSISRWNDYPLTNELVSSNVSEKSIVWALV